MKASKPFSILKMSLSSRHSHYHFFIVIFRFCVILGVVETHLQTLNNRIALAKIKLSRVKGGTLYRTSSVKFDSAGQVSSGHVIMQLRAWSRPLQWHQRLDCDRNLWCVFQCNAPLLNERTKHVFVTRDTRWKHVLCLISQIFFNDVSEILLWFWDFWAFWAAEFQR